MELGVLPVGGDLGFWWIHLRFIGELGFGFGIDGFARGRCWNWRRCEAIMHGWGGENRKRVRLMWSVPTVADDSVASTPDSFCKVLPWWVFSRLFRFRFLLICSCLLDVLY